jgi:hypothetical protein
MFESKPVNTLVCRSFVLLFFCFIFAGMSSLLGDTEMTRMQMESMRMIIASGDLLLAL